MLKEGAFEPSSPAYHSAELATIIEGNAPLSIQMVVQLVSVKLSLVALFFKLNLDYICAVRTTSYHSYCNPVERIMSILNLGLQAIALAREKCLMRWKQKQLDVTVSRHFAKLLKRSQSLEVHFWTQ